MRALRRVGIFGGTFDPIHTAHLIMGEEVRERLRLQRILFVPCGIPPHKEKNPPRSRRRLEMVRLAMRGNPFFSALDIEVRRPGTSYTVETLGLLHRRFRGGARFFFLIGMDAFREISTWHEAKRLPEAAHFVIFPRPGHPLENPGRFLPPPWKLETPATSRGGVTRHPLAGGKDLYTVDTEPLGISASTIRSRVRRGRSVRYLVPDAVGRYIRRHNLYRRQSKGG